MSIKEQAAKSVFWSAAERFSVQGIQSVSYTHLTLPTN